jgi:hypothetical protein
VSLPENALKYAVGAEKAGADAIKLHMNVKHRVTGKVHLSWNETKDAIKEIISVVKIPVGIVPGAEIMASDEDIREMIEAGISFVDAYAEYLPLRVARLPVCKMIALNHTSSDSIIPFLPEAGADCLELSIVHPEHYGQPLSVEDYTLYKSYLRQTTLPAFIPTQKAMTPDDCRFLVKNGFKGIIIGAIVTGLDTDNFEETIRKYRSAVQNG